MCEVIWCTRSAQDLVMFANRLRIRNGLDAILKFQRGQGFQRIATLNPSGGC